MWHGPWLDTFNFIMGAFTARLSQPYSAQHAAEYIQYGDDREGARCLVYVFPYVLRPSRLG